MPTFIVKDSNTGKSYKITAPTISAAQDAFAQYNHPSFLHPDDLNIANPEPAAPPSAGAMGNNPMAQAAGASYTPSPPSNVPLADQVADIPNQISAGVTAGIGALPAGNLILGQAEKAKAAVQGRTPQDVAATDQTQMDERPIAATVGRIAGQSAPYVVGGMFGPTATALGLSGGLMSRVALGTGSQFAIDTADNMAHGQDLPTAAKNSVIPALATAPFALFGKGPARSASRETAAGVLDEAGVPLTAGQRTGSRTMQLAESELGGPTGQAFNERQGEAFTKALLKTAGVNANRATPEVVDKAFVDIGDRFTKLASKTTVPFDQQLKNDVVNAAKDYADNSGMPAPIIQNMADRVAEIANANGGKISGEAYQNLRTKLGTLSASGDKDIRGAARELQSALDDAVERNMPPKFVEQWQQARKQYQNLLIIQDSVKGAGADAVSGIISPAHVRSSTATILGKSRYTRGAGDTNELARAGVEIMTPLANSNTAGRMGVRNLITGALTGGGAGALTGSGLNAALGAAAGAGATLIPGVLGRAMLSAPGRFVLGAKGTMVPSILAKSTIGQPGAVQSLSDWLKQNQGMALQ